MVLITPEGWRLTSGGCFCHGWLGLSDGWAWFIAFGAPPDHASHSEHEIGNLLLSLHMVGNMPRLEVDLGMVGSK